MYDLGRRVRIDITAGVHPMAVGSAGDVAMRHASEYPHRDSGIRHGVVYRGALCDCLCYWTPNRTLVVRVMVPS